jgi:hypothetical protein
MKRNLFFCLVIAGLLWGCSPATVITKSWMDPSLSQGTYKPFTKILVIARVKDATSNRIAEDKIVKQLKYPAVQSYTYLQPGDSVQAVVDARVKKDGFDGLIVMKLTDINKTIDYQPGTSYGGWYGYRYNSPGYLSTDQTFYVETTIYSIATGKMMWSCTTSTLNPTSLDQTLDEIIVAIRTELTKKGLIKQ